MSQHDSEQRIVKQPSPDLQLIPLLHKRGVFNVIRSVNELHIVTSRIALQRYHTGDHRHDHPIATNVKNHHTPY